MRLGMMVGLAAVAVGATASAWSAETKAGRETLAADAHWRFMLGDPSDAASASFNDASWRTVDLPHDWSIETAPDAKNPSGSGGGYFADGVGWYRRSFMASEAWKTKRVSVEFDGVASNATVYLNGKKLGMHPYAYTSFRFDLTDGLEWGKTNVLAVRVDESELPNSRWYIGAGIEKHVRMVITEPVHVAPWGVFVSTTDATGESAKVRVATAVENASGAAAKVVVKTTIEDAAGKVVASKESSLEAGSGAEQKADEEIAIDHVKLWAPEHPTLYRAVTELQVDGKVVDRVETPFGVRTLKWSTEQGLLLNGKPVKLLGGSVHHDNGLLGAAAFDRAEERKAELLKAAGFNAVRTAHNPPSPKFLDACDRLGLLVLDEPFDVWTKSKAKYDYAHLFNEWWQKDVDAMVMRDRNHPSVVIWGIGNEIPEAWTPAGAPIAKRLADEVRSLDTTRPLTEAFPGATFTPSIDAVAAHLDIAGYNYNLKANSGKDHERVPGRIMMTTESLPSQAFDNWKLSHEKPYILGEFVWTAMDYLGESGIGGPATMRVEDAAKAETVSKMMSGAMSNMGADGKDPFEAMAQPKDGKPDPTMSLMFPGYPWHAADCGDIDLIGVRKPQSYYRDILWHGGDRVYAAVRVPAPEGKKIVAIGWAVYPTLESWTWPGMDGKTMQVEVYAGTEKARLYLNGKLIGEKDTGVDQERRTIFDVPYAPGVLKVVGVIGGREVVTRMLATVTAPDHVELKSDHAKLKADGGDLAYVMVDAVDSQGRLEPNAGGEVRFSISGPATIVAVGNGDGTDTTAYQGTTRKFFHGRALVVVRASRDAGVIRVKAESAGMKAGEVTLNSETAAAQAELQ
ncbi:MAG TPA: glycoside hydrolase family 2 TIM barrel-domain containing protein [Acidobacteriaceae bacterium]